MFTLNTSHGILLGAVSQSEFTRVVAESGSHFFDRETMKWFGTRNVHNYRGVAVVGLDTKAPEGVERYWVRVFTMPETAGGMIGADKVAAFHTRREADRFARNLADRLHAEDEGRESTRAGA